MNYLIIEGYKEAAECFAREAAISPQSDLAAIEERMHIRAAIQRGAIREAISRINDLNPDVLDANGHIAFCLQQQQLIELIRLGATAEALEFAQEEVAPRASSNPALLRELERTMTLLVFAPDHGLQAAAAPSTEEAPLQRAAPPSGNGPACGGHAVGALLDLAHRVKVANLVNAALLSVQSQDNESKLPSLMRLLEASQDRLSLRIATYPRLDDYVTGALSCARP